MNKTVGESVALAMELAKALSGQKVKIMIAPPFTALLEVGKALKGSNILLGAQNMAQAESGAYTGEISPLMLKDAGATVVILGHSERRHVYGEADDLINKKVKLALAQGLDPILCVGETLEEREKGITEKVVETQVREGLKGVSKEEMKKITIAYEPVWAIGTGKNATPEDANAVHAYIRKVITGLYDAATAAGLIIQYGGSVKPDNAKSLMNMENIDGALVGGASLTAASFVPIVKFNG
jgi:triosephosphate isomerase (TIM)